MFNQKRLKKWIAIIGLVLLIVLAVAQFIQPGFSNPAINETETLEASINVPAAVSGILERSCIDCHSNRTRYPWYSRISPVSWFMYNHIQEGRRELNFSIWGTYSPKRKAKKLEEICEQVKEKEMPLPSYTWLHRDAALSDEEISTLCNWSNSEKMLIETTIN